MEARGGAEAVAQEVCMGCDGGGGLALVLGQFADEGKDAGDVVGVAGRMRIELQVAGCRLSVEGMCSQSA